MKYKDLSLEERNPIYSLLQEGFSKKEISEKINRSPSIINRELRHNKSRVRYSHAKYPRYHYLSDVAVQEKFLKKKSKNLKIKK